jgi:uncharacterized protein YejL (UPF0352 family)
MVLKYMSNQLNNLLSQLRNILNSKKSPVLSDLANKMTISGSINRIFISNLPKEIINDTNIEFINSELDENLHNLFGAYTDKEKVNRIKESMDRLKSIAKKQSSIIAKNFISETKNKKEIKTAKKSNCANMLKEIQSIGKNDDTEGWQLEHITTAHDDIQEVYSYIKQKANNVSVQNKRNYQDS